MTNQTTVKMVLDAWNSKIEQADKLFDKLTDEQLQNEVAPNRNRGIYLLGHLTAVNDKLLPLLNFGEQLYPQLDEVFLHNPDKSKTQTTSATELKQHWKNINSILDTHFKSLPPDEWFKKHNSISAEDFAKEPYRNKLNVLINRTNHLAYHLGQLEFLNN